MRKVLFHRDFQGFTGGHLKVWNYFNHVANADGYLAQIFFSETSRWDETNPWLPMRVSVLSAWNPDAADWLFLGGYDWRMLPATQRGHYHRPIINLIQHVHHADPAHPLSAFLSHRAIRICVSEEVGHAIQATGKVNGPVFVIPNGIDLADLPSPDAQRHCQWLICGLKEDRSQLARRLAARMDETPSDWGSVAVLTKFMPRREFLSRIADARRVMLLPRQTEGFYLPMLEAMALGAVVICPDCVGNRSFRAPGFDALMPASFDETDLLAAMHAAQSLSLADEKHLLETSQQVVAQHTLAEEQAAFYDLLASVDSLW